MDLLDILIYWKLFFVELNFQHVIIQFSFYQKSIVHMEIFNNWDC